MPFLMGPWEIGLILLIILIVFEVGKLPQISGAMGKGIREFRRGRSGESDDAGTKMEHKSERYGTKSRLKTS